MDYINTLEDLNKYWGKSKKAALRNKARNLALDLISINQSFTNLEDVFAKPRIQFLYIHHIFEDEEKNFDAFLKLLSKHHIFISHGEAVNRLLEGNIDKPYISFSSDDGLKSNLKAAEILENYGAKACFFVNPNSIGLEDYEQVAEFCKQRLNMPPVKFLNWNDVEVLIDKGHEIGAHTMNHEDVSKMQICEFEQNLSECKDILESRCGNVSHFAYTYGKYSNFNKRAHDLVFEKGFDSCASGVRGCHVSQGDPISKENLLIRRDHIIGGWKLKHMVHFLIKSANKAELNNNFLPFEWM